MKSKRYPIQIWFLSDDLNESAKFHNNKQLVKSINGCMNAIVCTYFYFYGIHSAKFYKYYFSKERIKESYDKYFPLWPLKLKPPFNQYKAIHSKWTRKCREHYDFICNYLDILLLEYEYRYGKQHGLQKFSDWLKFDARKLNIPYGNLKKIIVPWKCLNPKFRNKDIYLGYRNQLKALIENDGGVKITDFKNRDVPDFLVKNDNKWLD